MREKCEIFNVSEFPAERDNRVVEYTGFSLPAEVVEANINAACTKVKMPIWKMILLRASGGMFTACGASSSSVAMHNISNVGLARLVAGAVFPVGLMMIVFIGGELFTGDCLMINGVLDKRYSVWSMLRVLLIVWFSNLIGSVVIAFLAYAAGQYNFTNGLLGAFTIKVALGKVNLSFGTAFASGIACNVFVCAAVLMAAAAKDIEGKVWAIFFPILAFVVSGYEHCVANMYYIPAGLFAMQNEIYVQRAMEEYGYTAEQLPRLKSGKFLCKEQYSRNSWQYGGWYAVSGRDTVFCKQKEKGSITQTWNDRKGTTLL